MPRAVSGSLGSVDQTREDWVVGCMPTWPAVRTVSPACSGDVFAEGAGWEFPVYLVCSLDGVRGMGEPLLKVFSLLSPPSSQWKRDRCRKGLVNRTRAEPELDWEKAKASVLFCFVF